MAYYLFFPPKIVKTDALEGNIKERIKLSENENIKIAYIVVVCKIQDKINKTICNE